MLPEKQYDNPGSANGRRFTFTSGEIVLQGTRGQVIRVEAASNAAGKLGHVVIHDLNDDRKTYRTHWSYFREHAELDQ